jgi:DNA gyrase/topoisomerase IV subunit B
MKAHWVEQVRRHPKMYFGALGASGVVAAVLELVSNALDAYLEGAVSHLDVTIASDEVVVSFDGPGIFRNLAGIDPSAAVAQALENPFIAINRRHPPLSLWHLAAGPSIGVVCAASKTLTVRTPFHANSIEAVIQGGRLQSWSLGAQRSTTEFVFSPDGEVFGSYTPFKRQLTSVLRTLPSLCPGLSVSIDAAHLGVESSLRTLYINLCRRRKLQVIGKPLLIASSDRNTQVHAIIARVNANGTHEMYCNLRRVAPDGAMRAGVLTALATAGIRPAERWLDSACVVLSVVSQNPQTVPSGDEQRVVSDDVAEAIQIAVGPALKQYLSTSDN